jgi:hypothetical protein
MGINNEVKGQPLTSLLKNIMNKINSTKNMKNRQITLYMKAHLGYNKNVQFNYKLTTI